MIRPRLNKISIDLENPSDFRNSKFHIVARHIQLHRTTLDDEAAGGLPLGGAHFQPGLTREFAEF